MIKKIFMITLLICFFSQVFAQTIQTNKEIYEKGEIIIVSGSGSIGEKIVITKDSLVLFENTIFEENFSNEFQTDFLNPSGDWKLKIGEEEKSIKVNSPPQALNFLINFFSPSAGEHQRGKEIKINVQVTDDEKPIVLAKVMAYSSSGEKIELSHQGEGQYFADYIIPFNAPIGAMNIIVTAKTGSFNSSIGGENKLRLNIIESPIILEVIQPGAKNVGLGEKINIEVIAAYASGLEVSESTQVNVKINNQEIPLQRQFGGKYIAEFTPKETGEITLEFSAVDSAQNSGKKRLTVIVGGFFDFFVQNLWAPAMLLALAFVSYLYLTKLKVQKKLNLNSMKKELDETKIKINSLDESYFNKKTISRESYRAASTDLRVKKANLLEKIKQFEKRNNNNKGLN